MTQAELENELATLRSRLAQLEDEQNASRGRLDKVASQSTWIGMLFAAAALVFALLQAAFIGVPVNASIAMPFLLTAIVLGLLRQLRAAPSRPR